MKREARIPKRVLPGVLLAVLLASSLAVAPSYAADEELIVNGGFENGTASWIVNNGNAGDSATLSITPDAYAGTGAVLTSARTTTGSGPMQDLTGKVQAGQTYVVKARIKYDNAASPATKQFFATMHYGGFSYTNLVGVTATKGQWAYINGTFTIPAGQSVTTARLFFETPWASSETTTAAPATHLMDFAVDEVSVIGAPPPPPPSKTIEVVGKIPGDHNPLISHKFGADGFAFAQDGRVYMFMTNDTQSYAPNPLTGISPQINYGSINQITLISSDDLVNWTDHGEIQVAGANGIAPFTNNSWAPGFTKKVVDGVEKYFLYYANGGGSSNVITGQSPLGPWVSERTSTLINGSTPGAAGVSWLFDPAPLVDDDGKAYLYFGGGPASTSFPAEERFNNPKNMRVIELGADMISTTGTAAVIDAPVAFEASQVFKRDGKYYLSYSSHFGGTDFGGNQTALPGYPGGGQIGYMISDNPMVWDKSKYAGVLFPNQSQFFGAGTGGNNHQSVFELNGKVYFTYHAPTVNKRINGNTTQGFRSTHIEEIAFNPDGTIQQVVGTYAGVDQVKSFNPYREFEAETIGWERGVATAKVTGGSVEFGATSPNLIVQDIDSADWTALSSVDFGVLGAATVTAKVRPLQSNGEVQVRLGSTTGPLAGTINVAGTAGQWTEVSTTLTGATGVQDVYFVYTGPAGDLFDVDTWEFTEAPAAPSLDVSVVAAPRCVGGKVFVTVTTTNADSVPVDVAVVSSFGSKSFTGVAAGKSVVHSFTTRAVSIAAGSVTADASAVVGGVPVAVEVSASYPAKSCS